jgi:hypothetical protein
MTLTETTGPDSMPRRTAMNRRIIALAACIVSAGGALAAGATAAAAANPPLLPVWQATQAPVPAIAAANPVTSPRQVTCAAPGDCVGVASFNNASGYATGVIEQLQHGVWKATTAPLPNDIQPPQKVTLTSVSCATRESCGVSGYLDTPTTRRAELLTLHNGHWDAVAAPLLPDTLADSQTLSAISCPRHGRCVAVGRYQTSNGNYQGLIEVHTEIGWRAVEAPLPADATKTANPYGGVDWVSCPRAGQCTTVGAYVDKNGNRQLFADVLTDGTWKSARLPVPAGAAANPLAYLGYVTCHLPRRCLAVGNYDTSAGAQRGLLETEVSGKWHAVPAPNPSGTPSGATVTINEASCATTSFCAATGNWSDNHGNNRGILETLVDGKWHAITAAAPAGDKTNRYMASVSCPADGWCVAAGSTNVNGLLEVYTDGKWYVTTAPLPNQGTFAVFQGTSVSCPSKNMCAAFGLYSKQGPPSTQQGLLETFGN